MTTPSESALRKFTREDRALIKVSSETGWSWRIKGITAVGVSPDGQTKITVGVRRAGSSNVEKITARQIYDRWLARRFGPAPDSPTTPEGREALAAVVPYLPPNPVVDADLAQDLINDEIMGGGVQKHIHQALESEILIEELEEEAMAEPRFITRERPWLARRSATRAGGNKYRSGAVVERTWSDGTVDYVCSSPGCGWNSTAPRSVASHYAANHGTERPTSDAAKQRIVPAADYTEPLTHHEYNPTQRLVRALVDYLEGESWETSEDLATIMLRWAHDRPDLPEPEAQTYQPLTSDQIVARIQALVGGPLVERIEELEKAVADRDHEIARLKSEWQAALAVFADVQL